MSLNVNIGLLGHVDSGKTSLAKRLSTCSSTACFDKNPQSVERGITIDLGFSSFTLEADLERKNQNYESIQYTLVDCPGHASLIKTIIGGNKYNKTIIFISTGSQIIDLVILVVDAIKGMQTQTGECLLLAEILNKDMIILLNKIDLIPETERESKINKMTKRIRNLLSDSRFKNIDIVPVSAISDSIQWLDNFKTTLLKNTKNLNRDTSSKLLMSIDHCFSIKGKGTVMTGTLLQGTIQSVEIPTLKLIKKVKSLQMFKKPVEKAFAGDRVGVCVTQFDPKLLERGLVAEPNFIKPVYGIIILMEKIKYYKNDIKSGDMYHMSIGHDTVIGKITLFKDESEIFDLEKDYIYVTEFENKCFALIEFQHEAYVCEKSFVIGSKLDMDINTNNCRIAFYGKSLIDLKKDYHDFLPKIKIYKIKEKIGLVQKVLGPNDIIAHSIFKKETKMQNFINMKIEITTGEKGVIMSSFGQGGKVKINFPFGLNQDTIDKLSKKEKIQVILKFKRYIYDKEKKVYNC